MYAFEDIQVAGAFRPEGRAENKGALFALRIVQRPAKSGRLSRGGKHADASHVCHAR